MVGMFWAGACLLWMMACLGYLVGLRHIVAVRERLVVQDLQQLIERVRSWQTASGEVSHREWREAAMAFDRILEALAGEGALKQRAGALQELRLLLRKQKDLMSGAPKVFPSEMPRRASEVERSLRALEVRLAQYNFAAGDAAFACERFPLSLMAFAVRLRRRPILGEGEREGDQTGDQ